MKSITAQTKPFILTVVCGLAAVSCEQTPSTSPTVPPAETVGDRHAKLDNEGEDVVFRSGPRRTGAFDGPGLGSSARLAWTVRLLDGKPITGSPLFTRQAVYVGTAGGNVAALDPGSGDRLWDLELDRPGLRPAALWNGILLLGHEGGVTFVDPTGGSVLWRHASGPVRGSPAVVGDTAYFATKDGAFSLDLDGRGRTWTREFKYGADSSPASDGNRVFLGTERSRLSALLAVDGATAWEAAIEGHVAATPLVTEDGVVVCGVLGRNKPNDPIDGVRAFDAAVGQPRWQFRTQASVSSPLAYSDGVVFFVSHAHRVGAIDTRTGELVWSFKAKRAPEPGALGSGPIVVGDTVYVAMGRMVHALDIATGTRIWKLELDSPVVSALTYRDRTLVVGSISGAVYAIAPAAE